MAKLSRYYNARMKFSMMENTIQEMCHRKIRHFNGRFGGQKREVVRCNARPVVLPIQGDNCWAFLLTLEIHDWSFIIHWDQKFYKR